MAGRGDGLLVLLLIQQNNSRFRQLALEEELLRRRRRRPAAFWVRPWLSVPRRLMYAHYLLMRELRMEDTASFCNFMRMEAQMFDELVDRLSPRITLQDTNWRKALEPGLNVAVTLKIPAWPLVSVIRASHIASEFHVTALPSSSHRSARLLWTNTRIGGRSLPLR